MKKKAKKVLSIVGITAMLLSVSPFTSLDVQAVGINDGEVEVNKTKIAFAGEEWWVIGDESSGIYPQADHVTLLAVTSKSGYDNIEFREKNIPDSASPGYTEYNGKYYKDNPSGDPWTTPNEYTGSTLQVNMEKYSENIEPEEYNLISARMIESGGEWIQGKWYDDYTGDGIVGHSAENQKLWALSEMEWHNILDDNEEVAGFDTGYWLRGPSKDRGDQAMAGQSIPKYGVATTASIYSEYALRPACALNTGNVLFASDASGSNGKDTVIVGGDLLPAEATSDTIKYTMRTADQKIEAKPIVTQDGKSENVSFQYSGATTGKNQYVSVILKDESGKVKYYGKLADSSSASSGTVSVPMAGIANGKYQLEIFSEQANDSLHTDFASTPVSEELTVKDGQGSVHIHVYDQEVISDTYKLSDADCENKAVYYKSCKCGEKGTETFETGKILGHKYTDFKDNGDGTHSGTCMNDATHISQPEAHKGGTATCMHVAQCELCKAEYGAANPNRHEKMVFVEKEEATYEHEGHSAYWYCQDCGKMYTGKDAKKEVTAEDIVISKLNKTETDRGSDLNKDEVVKTGDQTNIGFWSILCMVSVLGIAMAVLLKRRRN